MRSRHTIPCCRVEGWRKWRVFSRAGEPEESPLYLSAPRSHDDLEAMPPKEADKLYAERLGWLKDWIAGGTPWPDLARQKEIRNPPDEHPVDILIMAKMPAGPEPAPDADARTFIRRATFDLTGLPPSPDEITAFESDYSKDANAAV